MMNIYWTVGLLVIVLGFAAGESYALVTGQNTFSRYIWTVTAAFPPFPYFVGFLIGFLTCHFWWGGSVSFAPVIKTVHGWF